MPKCKEGGKSFLCKIIDPGPLDFSEKMQDLVNVGMGSKLRHATVTLVNDKLSLTVASGTGFSKLFEVPFNEICGYSIGPKQSWKGFRVALGRAAAAGAGFGGCAMLFMGYKLSQSSPPSSVSLGYAITMMGVIGVLTGALVGVIIQICSLGGFPNYFDMTIQMTENKLLLFVPPSQKEEAVAACEWAHFNKIETEIEDTDRK